MKTYAEMNRRERKKELRTFGTQLEQLTAATKGISKAQLCQITTELLRCSGVKKANHLPITDKQDAIEALMYVAKVAERFEVRDIFQSRVEEHKADLAARI